MRAVRILLACLAALIVLALLAAWQVPARLDWNRYRGTIESLASVTLGRPVTIAGPITLSLLPATELTAADVVVAGNTSGETPGAPALTVKALRLRVAPLPLLAGRVDARELALSGPELLVDWPLQHGELADWPPYWLSAFSARIENGRLRVGGLMLEQIDATLETTEAGGLISIGTGRIGGQAVRFSARLTAAGADGASGFNLRMDAEQPLAGVSGGFIGQLAADGGLTGRIDVTGPDLAQLIPPSAGVPTSGAPAAGAFKFAAAVKAAGERARFDDLALDLAGPNGATTLNGSATLRLAPDLHLDASLTTPRLELGPWMALLGRLGSGSASGEGLTVGLQLKAEAVAFGGGLMREFSTALDFMQGQVVLHRLAVRLPGEADLSLDGVVQRGDPARPRFDGHARLVAPQLRDVLRWLDGAGLRLLPELPAGVLVSTDLRAHAVAEPGLLALDRIEGSLDGAAMNGELRLWPKSRSDIGGNAPGNTPGSTPGNTPGSAAGSTAGGTPGSGPAIAASLELSALDLDPWLSGPPVHEGSTGRGFDVDLRLRAPIARLRGETIRSLLLDAAVQAPVPGPQPPVQPAPGAVPQGSAPQGSAPPGSAPPGNAPLSGATPASGVGRVTLRHLEATLRGVHVVASGTVADGGRLTEGKLLATTDNASALADLVPPAWRPAEAFWRGPAALNVQLAGPSDALGLKLALDIADARLEAQPVVDLRSGKWSGPVTLRHPGAPRLLALLGMPGAQAWLGEGSLSVIAQIVGAQISAGQASAFQTSRIGIDLLDLTAGRLRLNASLALDLTGAQPSLGGRIRVATLTLPEPDWQDTGPLPLTLLRGWRASVPVSARQVLIGHEPALTQAAGSIELADGVLRIQPFTAVLNGGALSGTLTVNAAAEPPTVSLAAALADAVAAHAAIPGTRPLDLLAGKVNATADLSAAGHSLAAMLATLSGGVKLDATAGVLSGFDLFRVTHAVAAADPRTRPAAEAALRAALGEGVTNFDRLTIRAEAQSGTLALQEGALSGTAGTAEISGSAGLGGHQLDLRVVMHPAVEQPPEIGVRLTGPWEKPHRSPELAGFLRWLTERRPSAP